MRQTQGPTRRSIVSRAITGGVLATLLTSVGVLASSASGADGGPAGELEFAEQHHPGWSSMKGGQRAVDAFGDRLDDVASMNRLTEAKLRQLLTEDPSMRMTSAGDITFFDPVPERPSNAEIAKAFDRAQNDAPYGLDQTFGLHSKPGSTKTIYLDTDGYDLAGTAWAENGDLDHTYDGYSTDADFATFSEAELAAIQEIWQRVAEDYAPFDVDVTTAPPSADAIDRTSAADDTYGTTVFISSDPSLSSDMNCGCGGNAWYDAFNPQPDHRWFQPAIVMANTLYTPMATAGASSHEVGHTLGLSHDGTSTGEYYGGVTDGLWAPIMGSDYYNPIGQWSKGEYPDANNHQDDFALMAEHGLVPRADDAANTPASAAAAGAGTTSGYISTPADKDVYALDWRCTSALQADATPAPVGPNLNIQLRLLNAKGAEIANTNPTTVRTSSTVASGLEASLSKQLTPGRYYLELDGTGGGTTPDSFTDYGSLGAYTLKTNGCTAPSVPRGLTARVNQITGTVGLAWTAPATDGGSAITGYLVRIGTKTVTLPASAVSYTTRALVRSTATAISVQPVNATGAGPAAAVFARPLPVANTRGLKVARLNDALKAAWLTPITTSKAPITGYQVQVNRNGRTVKSFLVTKSARSKVISGLNQRYRYTVLVRAVTGTSYGPWAKKAGARPR